KATPAPVPARAADIVRVLDDGVAAAKRALASIDDAKAVGMWSLMYGGKVIASMPRVGIVRTLLISHSIHHRGQLSVDLRPLHLPVPSVYGPTADENPFV